MPIAVGRSSDLECRITLGTPRQCGPDWLNSYNRQGDAMKDQRGCPQCSYVAGDDVVRCPECGSWMRKAQGIRRRGWVLIFLGFLLVAIMGTITFMVAPAMLSAGSAGARFTGTQEQAMLILGLFGLVIGFGF